MPSSTSSSPCSCTCSVPPIVDLTEAYLAKYDKGVKSATSTNVSQDQLLLHNLKRFGWSHMSIDLSKLGFPNSPFPPILVRHNNHPNSDNLWNDPKRGIEQLFDPNIIPSSTNKNGAFPSATHRTAESGNAGDTAVEPKQSWETRRCQYYNNHNNHNTNNRVDSNTNNMINPLVLQQITHSLHSIITTVNWILRLPPNVLVQDANDNAKMRCLCEPSNKNGPCNVDLLRVFYYEKVDPTTTGSANRSDGDNTTTSTTTTPTPTAETTVLGSSPHTDWGSWTVVWQDHVGGLQTFCQTCQVWRDVETTTSNSSDSTSIRRFVIHVGDATSLAMAHAAAANRRLDATKDQDAALSTATTKDVEDPTIFFPSPKHRVLSPTAEPRASLVYFVYPPPGQSLASLTKHLSKWLQSHGLSHNNNNNDNNNNEDSDGGPNQYNNVESLPALADDFPYDRYFLLHDQSSSGTSKDEENIDGTTNGVKRSPKEVLAAIFAKPMNEVFAEKWQQVQRSVS